jgi:hypothetical protein
MMTLSIGQIPIVPHHIFGGSSKLAMRAIASSSIENSISMYDT